MIAIQRGIEPKELADVRSWRLAQQIVERRKAAVDPKHEIPKIDGYDCVKKVLHRAQQGLCAYCGERAREKGLAVEHFRPKGAVDRRLRPQSKQIKQPGYWWLSWTWENLVLSCGTCNTPYKGIYFPIHGDPLSELNFDLSLEDALLVDPTREDPMDAITWRPVNWMKLQRRPLPFAIPHLRWKPMAKSPRGKKTIDFLGFRGELTAHITTHIRDTVWPNIEEPHQLMKDGHKDEAQRKWKQNQGNLFGFYRPFQAATYDAIHFLFPEAITLFGLERPGVSIAPWVTPVGLPLPPQGVSSDLWLRILACGKQGDVAEKEQLLLDLCTGNNWTLNELVERFPILTEATLKTYLRQLCAADRLRRTATGYAL